MIEFLGDNYIFIIIFSVFVLLVIIGYYADKNNLLDIKNKSETKKDEKNNSADLKESSDKTIEEIDDEKHAEIDNSEDFLSDIPSYEETSMANDLVETEDQQISDTVLEQKIDTDDQIDDMEKSTDEGLDTIKNQLNNISLDIDLTSDFKKSSVDEIPTISDGTGVDNNSDSKKNNSEDDIWNF